MPDADEEKGWKEVTQKKVVGSTEKIEEKTTRREFKDAENGTMNKHEQREKQLVERVVRKHGGVSVNGTFKGRGEPSE